MVVVKLFPKCEVYVQLYIPPVKGNCYFFSSFSWGKELFFNRCIPPLKGEKLKKKAPPNKGSFSKKLFFFGREHHFPHRGVPKSEWVDLCSTVSEGKKVCCNQHPRTPKKKRKNSSESISISGLFFWGGGRCAQGHTQQRIFFSAGSWIWGCVCTVRIFHFAYMYVVLYITCTHSHNKKGEQNVGLVCQDY